MSKPLQLELGSEVRDVISGFKGIVTGRCQYLTGCNQALVSAKAKGDTRPAEWFDESRLEVVKAPNPSLVARVSAQPEKPGFDKPAPIR